MEAMQTDNPSPWIITIHDSSDAEDCETYYRTPSKWVKMNYHGGLDQMVELAGVGFIVRDSKAEILIAGYRFLYKQSVAATEAYALVEGLKAAMQCDPSSKEGIIIEGDNLEVNKWLQNAEVVPQGLGRIVNQARELMTAFKKVKFSYVPRRGNGPADWLAGEACRQRTSYVWENAYPSKLLELCLRDNYMVYSDG